MRILQRTLFALAAAAAGFSIPAAAPASEPVAAASAELAQGTHRVMVMLRLGAEHYQPGSDYGGDYGPAMSEKARLRLARRIAREHGLKVIEAWPMSRIGVDCVIMEIPDGRTPDAVAMIASRRERDHAPHVEPGHHQRAGAGTLSAGQNDIRKHCLFSRRRQALRHADGRKIGGQNKVILPQLIDDEIVSSTRLGPTVQQKQAWPRGVACREQAEFQPVGLNRH